MSNLSAELLKSLRELPITENYTPKDRYADFRQVFMGTDQGKRVYRELLSWGHMFKAGCYGNPIDTHKMLISEGERNFVIKLMAAVNIDPPVQPTRARKK